MKRCVECRIIHYRWPGPCTFHDYARARLGRMVGYNVQMAVEAANHRIVAQEVTDEGRDRHRPASTANATKEAMARNALTVIARWEHEAALETTRANG